MVAYITTPEFNAMLGTFKKPERKKDKFYPLGTNKGLWRKDQCEDYARILELEAIAAINHTLIGVNGRAGKVMNLSKNLFKIHASFLEQLIFNAQHGKPFRRLIINHFPLVEETREKVTRHITVVRNQALEQREFVATFAPDWGGENYLEAIGEIVSELNEIQGEIDIIGKGMFFGPCSSTACAASAHFEKTWSFLRPKERKLFIETYQRDEAKWADLHVSTDEKEQVFKANTRVLTDLNSEIRASRKEANQAYSQRTMEGDYLLRGHQHDASANHFAEAIADEDGGYTIKIPAVIAQRMALTPNVRLRMNLMDDKLIARRTDAIPD